ncbi:MAG TPA: hypothetical protein VGJ20_24530 [Xanthobacteraceae bacterium]
MIPPQKSIVAAASLSVALLAASTLSADARGSHGDLHGFGFSHGFAGHGMHGVQFAGGRRYGNDDHIKAASEDRDKLLNTQIKSICRGC